MKRRGTKDYAHSVKKRSKRSYDPTTSELSTVTGSITFKHNDPNQNHVEPPFFTASIKNDVRPLSSLQLYDNEPELDNYGTFRNKGPYIIIDDDVEHVCHRKYQDMATEL